MRLMRLPCQGAKSVGVFHQNDGFGKTVFSGTKAALKKRYMEVHVIGTVGRNTEAIKTSLVVIMKKTPDAIVIAGTYIPLAKFVKVARGASLNSMLSTVSFVGTKKLVHAVGPAGEGLTITQVVPRLHRNTTAVVQDCQSLVETSSYQRLDFISLEAAYLQN